MSALIGDALVAFEQVGKISSTPAYVRKIMKECDVNSTDRFIGGAFDPAHGWDELISLASTEKGLIHRFLDENESWKRKLYPRVSRV